MSSGYGSSSEETINQCLLATTSFNLKDWVSLVALLIALVGLLFTSIQFVRSRTSQRAETFRILYWKMFDDDEFAYIFTLIDSNVLLTDSYGDEIGEGKRRERGFERLLAHFEVVCAMYRDGLLDKRELRHFDFNIKRIEQCHGFTEYRAHVEKSWPKSQTLPYGPYASLFAYMDGKL